MQYLITGSWNEKIKLVGVTKISPTDKITLIYTSKDEPIISEPFDFEMVLYEMVTSALLVKAHKLIILRGELLKGLRNFTRDFLKNPKKLSNYRK